jgi:hypothetical protein
MMPAETEPVVVVDGYLIPVDPAAETDCESCQ